MPELSIPCVRHTRAALLETIDPALDYAKAVADNKNVGMDSLFGSDEGSELKSLKFPLLRNGNEGKAGKGKGSPELLH